MFAARNDHTMRPLPVLKDSFGGSGRGPPEESQTCPRNSCTLSQSQISPGQHDGTLRCPWVAAAAAAAVAAIRPVETVLGSSVPPSLQNQDPRVEYAFLVFVRKPSLRKLAVSA